MKMQLFFLYFILSSPLTVLKCNENNFVSVQILGGTGNNLFQIAAGSALAWDNNAEPCFPDVLKDSYLYQHLFFRCNTQTPSNPVNYVWHEPLFSYSPITYHPDMHMIGYFQSEKYFSHYRDLLLKLFAPNKEDLEYIQKKYTWLLEHPCTIGVQVRYYKGQFPNGGIYPQYGKDYLEKAMAMFPQSALFIISSNDLDFTRKNIPDWVENVFFLENEICLIDLFLLSFCKHNIITNSSFGWWSAWLNQNPDKVVLRPEKLFHELPNQDYCPPEWISIKASYE